MSRLRGKWAARFRNISPSAPPTHPTHPTPPPFPCLTHDGGDPPDSIRRWNRGRVHGLTDTLPVSAVAKSNRHLARSVGGEMQRCAPRSTIAYRCRAIFDNQNFTVPSDRRNYGPPCRILRSAHVEMETICVFVLRNEAAPSGRLRGCRASRNFICEDCGCAPPSLPFWAASVASLTGGRPRVFGLEF